MRAKQLVRKIYQYGILIPFGLIIAYLTLLSLFSTSHVGELAFEGESGIEVALEHTYYVHDLPLLQLLVLAGLVAAAYLVRRFLCRKKHTGPDTGCADGNRDAGRRLVRIWALILFAAGCLLVFATQLFPVYDQQWVLQIAAQLREHDYTELLRGGYLDKYPFQSGIVLFYYLLSWVFGGYNVVAMQLLNVLFLLAAFLYLTGTALLLWDKTGRGWAWLTFPVCVLFLPILCYVTLIYGTIPSLALCAAAIYYELSYFRERKVRTAVLSSLCAGVAVALKMNSLVVLIAMFLLLIYDLIVSSEKRKTLLFISLMLISWLAMSKGVSLAMEGLTGISLEGRGVPRTAHIAMGLQEGKNASGWYNGYNSGIYIDTGYDPVKTDEIARESIVDSLKKFRDNPSFMVSFMTKKAASQWNNPTFECFAVLDHRPSRIEGLAPAVQSFIDGPLSRFLAGLLNFAQTAILAGVCFFLAGRRKKMTVEELILPLIFTGGFLFHLIWEAKCYYTIPYFVLLLPPAVQGYGYCMSVLDRAEEAWLRPGRKVDRRRLTAGLAGLAAVVVLCLVLPRLNVFSGLIGLCDGEEAYDAYLRQKEARLPAENGYYYIALPEDEALVLAGKSDSRQGDCASLERIGEPGNGGRELWTSLYTDKEGGTVLRFMGSQMMLALKPEEGTASDQSALGEEASREADTLPLIQTKEEAPFVWKLAGAEEGENVYYLLLDEGFALTRGGEPGRVCAAPFDRSAGQRWVLRRADEK